MKSNTTATERWCCVPATGCESSPETASTDRFALIATAAAALSARSCLIDGEAIASGPEGLADFQLLRRRAPAILSAFDLLELDGRDLRREPIEVRKAELAKLLRRSAIGLELNEHIDDGDASRVFEHACKLGFEGIVSKRKESKYQSGRSYDWLKMKNPSAPAAQREATEDWSIKGTR
jgi:bifunctional non-homologous end joining protein LigD